jgi:hypothetical protein
VHDTSSPVESDGQRGGTLAFAPPYERDGASVITATAARTHTVTRRRGPGISGSGLDAQMGGARPMGAFVVKGGRVRWHPVVDLTRVITTAEVVVGGVLIARRLAARPSGAKALVTMGPGGWVSMKGGAMAVRPANRAWLRRRSGQPTTGARGRRPWWARLLAATALEKLVG